MGVDHTIFFGPYVECKWQGEPIQERVFSCESSKEHKVKGKHNFCPTCGSKVGFTLVKTDLITSEVDEEEIREKVNERLYQVWSMGGSFGEEKTDYWCANVRIDGLDRKDNLEKYEEVCLEITDNLVAKEKEIFSNAFASEIEILKKHYKHVRVAWGILAYCW